MSYLVFNEDKILKLTRASNIQKAHGHDDISIKMIKICDKSFLEQLVLLFQNPIKSYFHPDIGKRSHIILATLSLYLKRVAIS